MRTQALEGGFANAPIDAAHAFRAVMNAMARPGTIEQVRGAQLPVLSIAAGVVLLTLCDPETPVYLTPSRDTQDVRDWIAFHTGAPICAPADAAFALGDWDQMPLAAFPLGSAEYPDRSTTLIVKVPTLSKDGATLRGPGIERSAALNLPDLQTFQANAQLFPRGLDFIFTCDDRLAGLPRTTRVS